MKKYKRTKELNKKESSSTGSCTAFYGKTNYDNGKHRYMFFELADCQHKIRLHNTRSDKTKDFINKLKLVRSELDKFIDFLDSK